MATHEYYKNLGQELLRRCYAEIDPDDISEWLHTMVHKVNPESQDDIALMMWDETFPYHESLITKREAAARLPEDQRRRVDWAWESWNRYIDPLEPGMLAVISAPDGSGKTVACEMLAEHWARNKLHVVFVHFELNRDIMLDRRAVRNTRVERRVLKNGGMTQVMREHYQKVMREMQSWVGRIDYLHTPGWSMDRVTAALTNINADHRIDVVVIDYLEKASSSTRQLRAFGSSKFAREADDVEILKSWAENQEVPIVCLAQMNKSGKGGDASGLDRTSIRGAGEKTEKSNVVVLMHRGQDSDGGYADLVTVKIDKNTLGPTASFHMRFDGQYFSLLDEA